MHYSQLFIKALSHSFLDSNQPERGGRGEHHISSSSNRSRSNYGNNNSARAFSPSPYQSLDTSYMNSHMLERIPRHQTAWPSTLSAKSRAATEARELSTNQSSVSRTSTNQKPERREITNQNTGFMSSFALEHPKQQPCRYATALRETALSPPPSRTSRSKTVMPSSTPSSSSSFRSNYSSYGSLR